MTCTSATLIQQFDEQFKKMNELARKSRVSKNKGISFTQHKLWMEFLAVSEMAAPDLCSMVRIMISVPPNTLWIERAYSMYENICSKRRNELLVDTKRELFFLSVLKLDVKEPMEYEDEMNVLSKS